MSLPTSPGWHTPQDMKEARTRTILIEVSEWGWWGKRFRDEDIQNFIGWYCWWKKSQTTTCDVYKTLVNNRRNYQPQLVSRISSLDSIFHVGFRWNKSSQSYSTFRFSVGQRWSKLRTYLLRWWQKHCASCIQVLWNGKMIVFKLFWNFDHGVLLDNRMGFDWDGATGTHVESRVKEVIQWSKIMIYASLYQKMSSFPVFLALIKNPWLFQRIWGLPKASTKTDQTQVKLQMMWILSLWDLHTSTTLQVGMKILGEEEVKGSGI